MTTRILAAIAAVLGFLLGAHCIAGCRSEVAHKCQAEDIARLALERADRALAEQEATLMAMDEALRQLREDIRTGNQDLACLVRPYHRLIGRAGRRDYRHHDDPVPALWVPHSILVIPPEASDCSARFRVREERR